MKQMRRLPQAEQDIKDAVWYYAGESMSAVDRFLREIKETLARIEEMPDAGSPRFSHDLEIPNLRANSLQNFPYLLFYFERDDHIDLVRVLHTHRDIFDISFGM